MTSGIDIAHFHPLCVAVEVEEGWIDLTARSTRTSRPNIVRIQAANLREAQRKTTEVRSHEAHEGRDPRGVTVLIDVEVMTACDGPRARTALARLDCGRTSPRLPRSLLYVGTPVGLGGLIADIFAVNVADGVTLQPLTLPGVLDDIAGQTLPWLETVGFELAHDKADLLQQLRQRLGHPDRDARERAQFQLA